MLDIKKIIENKQEVLTHLNMRGDDFTSRIDTIIEKYTNYTEKMTKMDEAKSQINNLSKKIGEYKREGKDASEIFAEIEVQKNIVKDDNTSELRKEIDELLGVLPNMLQADTPIGNDDNDNVEIKRWGTKPSFDFEVKEHYEVGTDLGGFDFERATKLSKSRFVVTKGLVAKLERALSNFMLDEHAKRDYEELAVPLIASADSMYGSGQLPKFEDDLFKIEKSNNSEDEFENERSFYLIPTGEVMLANYYRDEIIDSSLLPIKYCTYSQCFRKEAGSAGRDTRGIIRMHQFGKVELFKYTKPENSNEELEKMVVDAENILQKLGLHYRIVRLCSGDMGFGMSKTYDLEVWFPAQQKFREVSSCSNAWDFQARRSKIRYKDENNKTQFVHMLNGSGMATGRILAAILENFQQADGTIEIPECLAEYIK